MGLNARGYQHFNVTQGWSHASVGTKIQVLLFIVGPVSLAAASSSYSARAAKTVAVESSTYVQNTSLASLPPTLISSVVSQEASEANLSAPSLDGTSSSDESRDATTKDSSSPTVYYRRAFRSGKVFSVIDGMVKPVQV